MRREVSLDTDVAHRAALGQFFTPRPTAELMAGMAADASGTIRLLDAGAGIGSLAAAWIAEMCGRARRPEHVSITAYELDKRLLPALNTTLASSAAAAHAAGMHVTWEVRDEDFISASIRALDGNLFGSPDHRFDAAILNPPYRKFRSDSPLRSALSGVGIETSNLYAAFLTLAIASLRKGADLVAITPRSFCNGPYFRTFRQYLLEHLGLRRIHVFESRGRAFRDDDVLQENIILAGTVGVSQSPTMTVSSSRDAEDPDPISRNVPFEYVVRPGDANRFVHLVPDDTGHAVSSHMRRLPCRLADLGVSVSTGRVVDFRATDFLRQHPGERTVPLIYPGHFTRGVVDWPKAELKKPNAILRTAESQKLLVPGGIYVLVKRFSAKEEPRRVVAAFFDPDRVPTSWVGFENHLNYFHEQGRPLSRDLALGLAAFLNSTPLDQFFRQFSGHTQVNATDLRSLQYPTRRSLEALGRQLTHYASTQAEIDGAVAPLISEPS